MPSQCDSDGRVVVFPEVPRLARCTAHDFRYVALCSMFSVVQGVRGRAVAKAAGRCEIAHLCVLPGAQRGASGAGALRESFTVVGLVLLVRSPCLSCDTLWAQVFDHVSPAFEGLPALYSHTVKALIEREHFRAALKVHSAACLPLHPCGCA